MAKPFINAKFKKLLRNLDKLKKAAPAAAKAITIEFAAEAAQEGKVGRIIPKISGNLRSTSRVEVEDNSVLFITGGIRGNPSKSGVSAKLVNYAFYVNNGTSKQPPQFFMEKIVALVAGRSTGIYKKALISWLRIVKSSS